MPRAQQSLETRIVQHFNSAPIGEAVLLHRLIGENLKFRKEAEGTGAARQPASSPSPARSKGRANNAGTKKKGGKKKSASHSRRATDTGGAGAPQDDKRPE